MHAPTDMDIYFDLFKPMYYVCRCWEILLYPKSAGLSFSMFITYKLNNQFRNALLIDLIENIKKVTPYPTPAKFNQYKLVNIEHWLQPPCQTSITNKFRKTNFQLLEHHLELVVNTNNVFMKMLRGNIIFCGGNYMC